ncbi:MAG: orotate phosphoribosyltransferase [Myxococcales bacterium]|nr:orotate phosphoribosyltransferase [Myxococcales bacterium]
MDRLLELLREHSVRRGEILLSSGKTSDFFVDCKQTVLRAEGHVLVGAAMAAALRRLPGAVDAVAGVELGGCPLASAVAMHTQLEGEGLDAVYVRKAEKGHGSRRRLEGDGPLPERARIAILEDVVTTGGSTLRAVEAIRGAGYEVAGVVAIVDRGEGGAEAIEQAGIPFLALYGRGELIR